MYVCVHTNIYIISVYRYIYIMGDNINLNNNIIITGRYTEAGWGSLIYILLYNGPFNCLSLNFKFLSEQGL